MASKNKIIEVQGWLSRQYRIDFTPIETNDDWGRAFDKLTDAQMDLGRDGIEEFYNNSTFPPTTAIFLKYAKAGPRVIPPMDMRTVRFWKDEKGYEFAVLRCEPKDVPRRISTPEGEKGARERYQEARQGFIGETGTPLYKINKLLKDQGIPTYESQQAWDDAVEAKKTGSRTS